MRTEARFIIIGAGGHGKVVADALSTNKPGENICFADDSALSWGLRLLDFPILGSACDVLNSGDLFHVAIGNNWIRAEIHGKLNQSQAFNVFHQDACVSKYSTIGEGVFVAAKSVIAPSAVVGNGVIINHAAVVDHDCDIGNYTHVAPNATLGGGVKLGRFVLVGAGATVLPGVTVGDGAIIAAGAVVIKDVCNGETVFGVPAKTI